MSKFEFKDPQLIQRLLRPDKAMVTFSPFSFGKGLENGGVPKEAVLVLAKIFQPEYMGSPEFEDGGFARALESLFKSEERMIVSWTKIGEKNLYIMAPDNYIEGAETYVMSLLGEDPPKTKEEVYLKEALLPSEEPPLIVGWVAFGINPFIFTIDDTMGEELSDLFKRDSRPVH